MMRLYMAMWLYGCMAMLLHGTTGRYMATWLCMAIWLHGYMSVYDYMGIWLYGYMTIWVYGCMVIWLYEYMVVAWYGFLRQYGCIWLYGYMDDYGMVWLYIAIWVYCDMAKLLRYGMAVYGYMVVYCYTVGLPYGYMAIWLWHGTFV